MPDSSSCEFRLLEELISSLQANCVKLPQLPVYISIEGSKLEPATLCVSTVIIPDAGTIAVYQISLPK